MALAYWAGRDMLYAWRCERDTTYEDMPWPKKGDNPFAEGASWRTNISIEWYHIRERDETIADAFKDAAEMMVDRFEADDHGHPDRFFFPVAYLYRHALELKMKCLIRKGQELGLLSLTDEENPQGHNLHHLWEKTREALEAFWPGEDKAVLRAVEKSIIAFHKIDKTGQGFRYAEATDNTPHLRKMPQVIDLAKMRDVVAGVFNLLDGCSMAFQDALNNRDAS